MTDQNTRNLKKSIFSAHSIVLLFLCQGGVSDHGFSRSRLVTPLASAQAWRQRQNQRFAPAQPKIILKQIPLANVLTLVV